MTRRPRGIDGSDEFFAYLERLRETWSASPHNAGRPTDTGLESASRMSTSTPAERTESQPTISRRRAMQSAAAGIVVLAAGTPVAAASEPLDPDAEVGSGDPLAYVADDGTETTLTATGYAVRERPAEDEPHNPLSLSADRIDTAEFTDFPRGVTDSDDNPISALDAAYWTLSSSSISATNTTPESGGSGLTISASGLSSGTTETARFTDVAVDSGALRKQLQVGVNIVSLASGTTVEIAAEGKGGTQATAVIDPAATDTSRIDLIANATGTGIVYQVQLGELVSDMDGVNAIEIAINDADAEIELFALNTERESAWTLGETEVWNSEDEVIETNTIEEPSGTYSIATFDSLDEVFEGDQSRSWMPMSPAAPTTRGPSTSTGRNWNHRTRHTTRGCARYSPSTCRARTISRGQPSTGSLRRRSPISMSR